jgi:GAF domain-containing protein
MGLAAALQDILEGVTRDLDVGSGAIFLVTGPADGLQLIASTGLGPEAAAGLTAAVASPGHPIQRTVATPVATFDVRPVAPGGPSLRAHVPLIQTRGGTDRVLGVLALAYDRPMAADERAYVLAAANLAAAAIERDRPET